MIWGYSHFFGSLHSCLPTSHSLDMGRWVGHMATDGSSSPYRLDGRWSSSGLQAANHQKIARKIQSLPCTSISWRGYGLTCWVVNIHFQFFTLPCLFSSCQSKLHCNICVCRLPLPKSVLCLDALQSGSTIWFDLSKIGNSLGSPPKKDVLHECIWSSSTPEPFSLPERLLPHRICEFCRSIDLLSYDRERTTMECD